MTRRQQKLIQILREHGLPAVPAGTMHLTVNWGDSTIQIPATYLHVRNFLK